MHCAIFSTKNYERPFLTAANDGRHDLTYLEPRLTAETSALARDSQAVCAFVNDDLGAVVVEQLSTLGVRGIALRSAGFNHVNRRAAAAAGMRVARVPAYSPHAVAEHAAGLILTLNRKLHRAYVRVREGNFSLDGLLGFDLHDRVVGIVGTGNIGTVFARIMAGFGCRLLAADPYPTEECRALGVRYTELDEVLAEADILALHCPLTPQTHHLLDSRAFERMKDGVMVINTSRGGLIDTRAAIRALKSGRIGALGLDVYEEEEHLFFEDLSGLVLHDDIFARLLTFPNVVITGHQGFFTREAMQAIASTTIANLDGFESGAPLPGEVPLET